MDLLMHFEPLTAPGEEALISYVPEKILSVPQKVKLLR